eukprot:CAMPEP_0185754148 /NCGR_PEP_ID=MMETSP1174-20130828/12795_1 /TAXON_ID=35687 /ORGANISM="Dictyocha speculum, Strain CCMP1381" /LENGTH=67 /DNA_ID=CAMNT_0028432237 /DNA_START=302 /DNA_END=505 /DNA_ORIENTATION=+
MAVCWARRSFLGSVSTAFALPWVVFPLKAATPLLDTDDVSRAGWNNLPGAKVDKLSITRSTRSTGAL